MTTFRSSAFRPFGALLTAATILGLTLAAWMGFVGTVMWSNEKHPHPFRKAAVVRHPFFAIPAAVTLLFGLPLVLAAFTKSRGRYRLGPTELEITEGCLFRASKSLPYADITGVEVFRGPLMRLVGTTDLTVATTTGEPLVLYGLRGASEIRDHLLARRDSLLELKKAEEDASALRAVQRLAAVLERLEKRV